MTEIRCLIIEDDWSSQKILENFIQRIPVLKLEASCSNPQIGIKILESTEIDLLFLDVKMPQMTGIDLLKTLQERPATILVTAHADYAIEAFDLGVIDFLLKPFTFERFETSVSRVITHISQERQLRSVEDHLYFKLERQNVKILVREIIYFEAFGNYVKIYLEDKKMLLVNETFTSVEGRSKNKGFLRIHKSFIVNTSKVEQYGSAAVQITNQKLPVGISYRKSLRF